MVGNDLIFLTDGYSRPGIRPIYAVRPGALGDVRKAKGGAGAVEFMNQMIKPMQLPLFRRIDTHLLPQVLDLLDLVRHLFDVGPVQGFHLFLKSVELRHRVASNYGEGFDNINRLMGFILD